MDILKLREDYEQWKVEREIETGTEETLWSFLACNNLLCEKREDGGVACALSIMLYTDGDFFCVSDDSRLVRTDYESYYLFTSWDNVAIAVDEAVAILLNLKGSVKTGKDAYLREDLDTLFDSAIRDIREKGFTNRKISGNYEGTQILFQQSKAS